MSPREYIANMSEGKKQSEFEQEGGHTTYGMIRYFLCAPTSPLVRIESKPTAPLSLSFFEIFSSLICTKLLFYILFHHGMYSSLLLNLNEPFRPATYFQNPQE